MSHEGLKPDSYPVNRRRNSLNNWLIAIDYVQFVNKGAEKFDHPKIDEDQVDGQSCTDPETIFSKIVEHSVVGTGIATRAAILTKLGQVYANDNLALTADQIRLIVETTPEPQNFAGKGIPLGAKNFHYASENDGIIEGKLANGEEMCIIAPSKHLILIMVFNKEKESIANELARDLQKRFKESGV